MTRLAIGFAFVLAGCASGETVILRNASGMTVQCGPYSANLIGAAGEAAVQAKVRDCVSDYQRQGFERIPGR